MYVKRMYNSKPLFLTDLFKAILNFGCTPNKCIIVNRCFSTDLFEAILNFGCTPNECIIVNGCFHQIYLRQNKNFETRKVVTE